MSETQTSTWTPINLEIKPKEKPMQKYIIIIGENNEETSREVQEALFEAGFEWVTGASVKHCEYPAISIEGKYMSFYIGGKAEGISIDIKDGHTALYPSEAIRLAKEGKLDGCKKKHRYTMDEIAELAGVRVEDLEIVKGESC